VGEAKTCQRRTGPMMVRRPFSAFKRARAALRVYLFVTMEDGLFPRYLLSPVPFATEGILRAVDVDGLNATVFAGVSVRLRTGLR
jgi:hypothetical protein